MQRGFFRRCCGLWLFAVAFFFITAFPIAAADRFPKPTGAVNDFAGLIGAEYKNRMEALAEEVLEKTGTAMVAATVETVGDNDPADYANRLYQAWGIGRKGEDKGVLIFLAARERRVRIETGYGVEGIIPDGLAGGVLDRYAVPYFRQGDYGRGFYETMASVSLVLAKAAGVTLTGVSRPAAKPVAVDRTPGIVQLLFFLAAAFFLLGTRQGRAMLPWLLLMMTSGGRGGGGFGGFGGGGFGGFGGGSSGGGGAGRGF